MKTHKSFNQRTINNGFYYKFTLWYYDAEGLYIYVDYICETREAAENIQNRIKAQRSWCESLGYKFDRITDIVKQAFDK